MAELEGVVGELHGSFQNQTGDDQDAASASRLSRSAIRKAASVWKELRKGKPRGNPRAAYQQRVINKSADLDTKLRRKKSDIVEDAVKELESLADYTPDLPDSDARVLALRLYYIELADGVPPSAAQDKVSKMFLVSSRTVQRWAQAWEETGEEAITDKCSATMHNEDHSILFLSPTLVFELRHWIKKRLKLGGKHEDGFLTIQHIQTRINDVYFKDQDVVSPEVLDIHEARYHSREVSRMTVFRWMYKLGFKWSDSSTAPFCDRHEDEEIVVYRNDWVKKMMALKPRLPVLNEQTGRPEWPNLPVGERPLLHGNHDEAILYANEGNRFAWVANDSYHLKPKGDGATIMISGVSVACHGWMGLEVIEPKTDGTWKHANVIANVNKVLDEFEAQYPGCQILLTYDNAPCHVAKRQGALSTAAMNLSDGGKQPILTQTGWFDTIDASTGTSAVRIQQQMWFTGTDGSQIAKGGKRSARS